MVNPILPTVPVGSPLAVFVSDVHVVPPSVDFQIALPVPPDDIAHDVRYACQVAAYITSGLDGSRCRSMAPVESLTNSTLLNVLPPSVVL
jgi:hypothetical protein